MLRLRGRAGARRTGIMGGAALSVAALAIGLPGPASAGARGLKTGFIDNPAFASRDASVRSTWLNRAVNARAGIVRVNVRWRSVAPSEPVAPTNPADPAYHFSWIDAAVKDAHARGLQVMLTVHSAPNWAQGKNEPSTAAPGAWKPNPKDFGEFAQAVAKRYSGHFLDLPRAQFFEAWNEPNLSVYLAPQWKGRKSKGPELYRRLLNHFYQGVKKAQPGAKVIGGATAPFGDPRTKPRDPNHPRMRPLTFLQKLFCLKGRQKLRPTKCGSKPHLDILSHHPINFLNPPHYHAASFNDIEVADFNKVHRVLQAAKRYGHVKPGGRHGLWATETFWTTTPPSRNGVPVHKAAKWVEEGLYLLWKQGASTVINYEIRDPATRRGLQTTSGVFFHDGSQKPAYRSFRFPFVTHRKNHRQVGTWGKAPRSGKLEIQKKRHGHWVTAKKLHVHQGQVFHPTIRLRSHATLRAKIGHTKSLAWHQ